MDINIQVTGEYIKQSGKTAGAAGSAYVNRLLLSFDESWDSFAKKVILYNAKGENPVEITLTTDYLVDFLGGNFRDYAMAIPAEPLEYAGDMQYAIRGYNDATPVQIAKSVTGKLTVLQSASHVGATTPADPTPTQAEQLQVQITNLLGDMSDFANEATTGASTATTKAGEAAASAAAAATSEDNAAASAASVATSEDNAAASALSASGSASTATTKAGEAATSASAAAGSASAASTSAGSAASSATSAGEAATSALEHMEDAEAAAVTATTKAGEASTSATNASNSATAAAGSATSAGSAKTAAEAAQAAAETAQAAAEDARDEAAAIVGGDYLTNTAAALTYETLTGATTKANTAETNAKAASVPIARTVNSKALSSDIVLTSLDIGAEVVGSCSTAAGTAAKTLAVTGYTLVTGRVVLVTMTNANTAASPTMNIQSTGAKAIVDRNGTALTSTTAGLLSGLCILEYDGTNYRIVASNMATSSLFGSVKLSALTNSTSGDTGGTAATPSAVKAAYDLAAAAVPAATHTSDLAGKADVDLGNVLDADFKTKAEAAGASGSMVKLIDSTTVSDASILDINFPDLSPYSAVKILIDGQISGTGNRLPNIRLNNISTANYATLTGNTLSGSLTEVYIGAMIKSSYTKFNMEAEICCNASNLLLGIIKAVVESAIADTTQIGSVTFKCVAASLTSLQLYVASLNILSGAHIEVYGVKS